jgi:hypothetical protein
MRATRTASCNSDTRRFSHMMAFAGSPASRVTWRLAGPQACVSLRHAPPCVLRSCAEPRSTRPPPADDWRALEQSWRFQHRDVWDPTTSQPRACPDCAASGTVECRFCSATGVLTLGDKLLCSIEGGTACPVCNGRGETRCNNCAGSGHIASWIVQ